MRRRLFASLLLALAVFTARVDVASACPNCKDSVGTASAEASGVGDENAGLPGGFNTSIYVMLTAFVGLLGFVGFTLYRGIRSTSTTQAVPVVGDR